MKKQISREIKSGKLSAALVDEYSEYIAQVLGNSKLSSKDISRYRFSVEDAMCTWLDELGEGAECEFALNKRFGKIAITISCEGKKCNPNDNTAEGFGELGNSSLLQTLGLSVGYSYEEGVNRIQLMPNSGFILQIVPIVLSFALGIALALAIKTISPSLATSMNAQLVDPIFSSLMSILRTVASPLIFLAVLSGIYGVGDIAALGTIGKKLLGRFVLMTFVTLAVTLGIVLLIAEPNIGTHSVSSVATKEMLNLVLQFIPTDIVSPFLNGNMLQIITISVACGLVMLILGDRVSELCKMVDQLYSVVQLLMEAIGKLVPIFIFISMLSLGLSDNKIKLETIVRPVVAIAGSLLVMGVIVYPIVLSVKYKISFSLLMRKLLPTFIVAFTTASSAAAFSVNVETCEKELGISNNITRFGVPLGQVVYMPIAAAEYLSLSMLLANSLGVKISIVWIVTAIVVSGILSIATPPIPGGSMSIFTVLFLQLGIPEIALPVALGVDFIVDYIVTAGDLMCLQEELVICADKTGLLDKERLISN